MCSKLRVFSCFPHDSNIRPLARHGVEHVKRVCPCVDTLDDLLSCPFPRRISVLVTYVGYVFMRTLRMRFGDASYLDISHLYLSFRSISYNCPSAHIGLCVNDRSLRHNSPEIALPKNADGLAFCNKLLRLAVL